MKLLTLFTMIAVCAGNKEYQLFKKINEDESIKFKPDGLVNVKLGITLQTMQFLPEKETFQPLVWMSYEWKDERLSWNDTVTFGSSTRMKKSDIWMPDIYLYNGHISRTMDTMAVISNDGEVTWIPPVWLSASCKLNTTNLPFGEQTCELKFGSWTYNGLELNLMSMNDEVDVSTFMSQKYKILRAYVTRNEVFYDCCKEPYIDITVIVTFKTNRIFKDGKFVEAP